MIQALVAAAERMYPAGVAVAGCDPRLAQPDLMPQELPATTGMVPARRREFSAGRAAVRGAMAYLGAAPIAVPMGQDRAPIWPQGMTGSISHSGTACLAVLTHAGDNCGLGIDIETAEPLAPELWDTICTPAELAWLAYQAAATRGVAAKAIFCAKEAAYKAQYTLTRCLFGFETLCLAPELDQMATSCFTARFTRAIAGFAAGDALAGRIGVVDGTLLAAVSVRR